MRLGIGKQKYMDLFHHQPFLKLRPMRDGTVSLIPREVTG